MSLVCNVIDETSVQRFAVCMHRVPVLSGPRKQTIINVRDSCFQTFMLFSESKADQMPVNVDILLATTVDTKGIRQNLHSIFYGQLRIRIIT